MTNYKGDVHGIDTIRAVNMTATHGLMLDAVCKKLGCSRSEVIRSCIEDLYSQHLPEGTLQPPKHRFLATDGRIYTKTR